jgi:hypothetical protein
MTEQLKYRAFVSYCRADRETARRLQRQLEQYVLPRALRFLKPGTSLLRRPLKPIFRDEDELVPGGDLPDRLRRALEQSEFLIVVCSPEAAKSEWVSREIATFIRLSRRDRILAVVASGEPDAVRRGHPADKECMPAALRLTLADDGKLAETDSQPLWVDWRGQKADRHRSFLRVTAALLGLASFDDLVRRDLQARRQRMALTGAFGVAAVALLGAAGYFAWSMSYGSVTYQTARFRTFYDAKLKQALSELEPNTTQKPEYRIAVADDLNSDGVTDFIVFNNTFGFCGSGGCHHEIYLGTRSGAFDQIESPSLFGKASVWARDASGPWKDVFSSDPATSSGADAVYNRNAYEAATNSYEQVESWYCGGLYFEYCDKPLIFCPHLVSDGSTVEVTPGATVFRAPQGLGGMQEPTTSKAPAQIEAPDEFSWIQGVTPDGQWFMVNFKFSGIFYARRADMSGALPAPRKSCANS